MVATIVNYFLIIIDDAIFILMNINLIPFPELTTDRLRLRRLVMDDFEQIQILRSDDEVNKYLHRSGEITVEQSKQFINAIDESLSDKSSVYWAITLEDDNLLIGTACFWNLLPEKHMAEIGYELMPAYQGKGLMQEAIKAVISYGFDVIQLKVIAAFPSPENQSSVKLLERNNFTLDVNNKYASKDDAGEQAVYVLTNKQ